jgi:hypothetical protein
MNQLVEYGFVQQIRFKATEWKTGRNRRILGNQSHVILQIYVGIFAT